MNIFNFCISLRISDVHIGADPRCVISSNSVARSGALLPQIWAFFARDIPPAAVFWACVAVYFCVSAFTVWKKEHQQKQQVQAELKDVKDATALTESRMTMLASQLDNLNVGEHYLVHRMSMGEKMTDQEAAHAMKQNGYGEVMAPLARIRSSARNIFNCESNGVYEIVPDIRPLVIKYFQDQTSRNKLTW